MQADIRTPNLAGGVTSLSTTFAPNTAGLSPRGDSIHVTTLEDLKNRLIRIPGTKSADVILSASGKRVLADAGHTIPQKEQLSEGDWVTLTLGDANKLKVQVLGGVLDPKQIVASVLQE